ncbi:MAG TPA: PH domain-containing protein [Candidatus Dormibacteraeota bacterium]|nr:PH domain-containing protein [Candidatus Dormibacteraeota bacterium]
MPYVDGLLATDERIVRRERQHWLWPVQEGARGVWILILGVASFALAWFANPSGALGTVLSWVALVAVVVGAAWLAWAILRWRNEEYVITSRRVIQAEGVLNKRASDSSLDKINDAQISVPLLGRILGFGDLEVMTASESGIERFRLLTDPVGFKRVMLDAKHDLEYDLVRPRMPAPPIRTDAPAAAPRIEPAAPPLSAAPAEAPSRPETDGRPASGTSADDVTRTLGALADLRDRGAITPEEFEAKKRELLARL